MAADEIKYDRAYWTERMIQAGAKRKPEIYTAKYIAELREECKRQGFTIIHQTALKLERLHREDPPKISRYQELTDQLLAYHRLMFGHKEGDPFPDGNSYEWHKAEYDRIYWEVFEYSTYKPAQSAAPIEVAPEPAKPKASPGKQETLF